jgi:hypothetical protein
MNGEVLDMTNCHEMKLGSTYMCKECGIELKVVTECKEADLPPDQCKCAPCTLVCCGEELVKKE